MHRKIAAIAALLAMTLATGVGRASPGFETGSCEYPAGKPLPGSGSVIDASDYASVQAAVNAASEGDTVRIHPATTGDGEYHEQVKVTKPGLRIQGTDRNLVRFDGDSTKDYAFYVLADRVLIENMTAHNYVETAFYWGKSRYSSDNVAGVTGYWGRYLTAYNNGQYGMYAFDARCGQFDHSYTSGNADSGFYIGECFPCDAVITNIVAENNAIGYSGTNAGGNLSLRDSIWRNNALGIVPNSLNGEDRPPQRGAMIENNQILTNNNATAPGSGIAALFYGVGIAIAGGHGNQVMGNTIADHEVGGVVLNPLPDPNPDYATDRSQVYLASGNIVWGNTVYSDTEGAYDLAQGATSGPNNCWTDNVGEDGTTLVDPTRTAPVALQTIWGCDLPAAGGLTPPGGDPRVEIGLVEGFAGLNGRDPADWKTYEPFAPPQTGMTSSQQVTPLEKWLPALGLMSW